MRDTMRPSIGCMFFLLLFITVSSSLDISSCDFPSVCEEERRQLTIFADVGDTITFNICIKSNSYLTWEKVRLGFSREKILPKKRFDAPISQNFHDCYRTYSNMTVYNVQESEFGPIIVEFTPGQRMPSASGFNYMILLSKKGIAFNIYKSLNQIATSTHVFLPGESLYLMCESSDYPLSSLSIVKKYSKEILPTTIPARTRMYRIESVQCSHMGTYMCLYENNTSYSTLDVKLFHCPLQLCDKEAETRTVFASLRDNVHVDICVISMKDFKLDSVFLNGNSVDKLAKRRYGNHSISRMESQKLYWKVNLVLQNIQKTDFGNISINLTNNHPKSLIYEMVLAKQGTAFNFSYMSTNQVATDDVFDLGKPLYLKCKSSYYPLSSLNIVKKYSEDVLKTTVTGGALVYYIKSLQCSDMGTYMCLYNNDNSLYQGLDVKLYSCPPLLCHKENETRTIFAAVNDNVSVDICVVSREVPRLDSVFRNRNRTDKLVARRYRNSIISTTAFQKMYWNVKFELHDIRKTDFGELSIDLTSIERKSLIYDIALAEKEFDFATNGSSPFNLSENVKDGRLSSLSMVEKDNNQSLKTSVMDRARAPTLCPEENYTSAVTVELSSNLNISICVISQDDFFLERVFLGGREDKTLEKNRYKPYNSSEITGEDLYHSVDIKMYNITEEDFGNVTFRLRHVSVVDLRLDFEVTLQQTTHTEGLQQNSANESTRNISATTPMDNPSSQKTADRSSDTFMIYVISGVCAFVALVLVAICIYCQIRVKNYRNNGNHTARTEPDAQCVLLNYLPKHVADGTTGGLKQSHDDVVCTTSFYKASANDDDDANGDDEDDKETENGFDDELQLPGYHIYEVIK